MPESDAEIVVETERPELEVNLTVTSANEGAAAISRAGGRVIVEAFDIPIGRCTVVQDPSGNRLVLLDNSKGLLPTDETGRVLVDEDGKPKIKHPKRRWLRSKPEALLGTSQNDRLQSRMP